MKAVVLAAGYATRLYPLTLNRAKPLLPLGGRSIIDYTVEGISRVPDIDTVYVVTNDKFYADFLEWQKGARFGKDVVIVNDGTVSDEDKLGAIGDMDFVIRKMQIRDDLVVVAGDNLFSFNLREFVDFFNVHGVSIAAYKYPYKDELSRYGIVGIDRASRVISFQEKPKEPGSDLVAVCLYGFPGNKLGLISEYLESAGNKDAPGYYLQWLANKEEVYAFVFRAQWHDIGSPEAYKRAQEEYGKNEG